VSKSIQGDLDTFTLPDLLQWLEMSGQSGRATLTRGRVRRSIDLQGGKIVFVSSTLPEERLGTYLIRTGVLTPTAAYSALAENLLTGRSLTRIILERGLATRERLARAVEGLAVEILLASFHWKGASFEFDPEIPTENILQIQLSLRGQILAMHGAKALDELPGPASGQSDAGGAVFAWGQALTPEAATGTFWSILEWASPDDTAPETLQELFSDFQRFVAELERRLAAPLRFGPIYDDTAVILRRALAQNSSNDQLVQVSALDPFLTLNLVSFANALHTGPEPIVTVRTAAASVGEDAFRLFLDLGSRRDAIQAESASPFERVIRASSISTAVASSRVARRLDEDEEAAYTAGLLGPVASYEPLRALLAIGFEPGKFRAGVLREIRPLWGAHLARKWDLPEELSALLGSSGTVAGASPGLVKLVYLASQLISVEGIGCELVSEEPELVETAATLASDAELLAEIRRDTEQLFEIIGLP
jgi:HD-like signal output (HDOD) protein